MSLYLKKIKRGTGRGEQSHCVSFIEYNMYMGFHGKCRLLFTNEGASF